MSTPPRAFWVTTPGLEPGWPTCWALVNESAAVTAEMCSTPGLVVVATTWPGDALPPGVSLEIVAWPEAAEPGIAVSATELAVTPADPGAGHILTAVATGTLLAAAPVTDVAAAG
jgi:hypothetical protein